MSLTDFTDIITKNSLKDAEITKYIPDKRILRVLFENRIFQLREIQKEAIQKGLFLNSFMASSF